MAMVKVYHFKVYDGAADEMHIPPLKSQKGRIEMVGGSIIPDSEEEVDESELDNSGRFNQSKKKGNDAKTP